MSPSEPIRYSIPASQRIANVLRVSREMQALPLAPAYELDVSEVQHCEPFGFLLLASAIRALRARVTPEGVPVLVRTIGRTDTKQGHNFAEEMGFWWSIGEDAAPPSGLRTASDRYVRVDYLSVADLYRQAAGADPIRSELVSRRAAELATVLSQETKGPIWQALEYSFREMLRNAIEHSGADKVWFAAWTRFRGNPPDVQVAILDEGRGVRNSLLDNPAYSPSDDAAALKLALQPGISRNVGKPRSESRTRRLLEDFPGQDPSQWDNSGYGLYLTSELAKRTGQFAIASYSSCLAFVGNHAIESSSHHTGTAVRISLNPLEIAKAMDEVFALANGGGKMGGNAKRLISASMMRRLGLGD